MLRNNKGITLISLIILIVVLLVLATITLSSITGEESVIKYAQNAQASTETSDDRNQGILGNIIDIGTEGILGDKLYKNLADIASIGDYVNYDPTTGGNVAEDGANITYTSMPGSTTEHGNGYTPDADGQTFSAKAYKNSGGKWRILNVEGKTITLISDLIYRDDKNGTAMLSADDKNGLYLYNGTGYLWAEEELHRIASIYGHGDGADTNKTVTCYYGGPNDQDGSISVIDENGDGVADNIVELQQGRKKTLNLNSGARALTVEDINKICDAKDSNGNRYGINYSSKTLTKVANNATYYPTIINPADSSTGKSSGQTTFSGKYYETSYAWLISSANTDTSAQTNQNDMLKLGQEYWLASRCIWSNSTKTSFAINMVNSANYINNSGTVQCEEGSWFAYSGREAVRAIVTLKSGIQTSDTEYNSATGWNLAK